MTLRNIATAPAEVRPRARRIGRLHADLAKALHALLTELADFDEDEVWRTDGASDMAAWLGFELGLLPRTAKAWLEVARRLDELPTLRHKLGSGELSLDQVRALCPIATPDNESELAEMAEDMTAAELERMARKATPAPRTRPVDQEVDREVRWWWDRNEQYMHLSGTFPAAEGAIVERALLRISHQEYQRPIGPEFRALPQRAADALTMMASEALGRAGDPDRASIVVHVSAEALTDGEGTATIEHGPVIDIDTARRLACDAHWRLVADGSDGTPIGVGRRTRRIPGWLSHLVRNRDAGCRFPGCGRTRWTHLHHIRHWAEGGPTDLDNLVTLCGHHHRRVHNEGWTLRGDPNRKITWVSPYGWTLRPARTLPYRDDDLERRLRSIDEMTASRGSPRPAG